MSQLSITDLPQHQFTVKPSSSMMWFQSPCKSITNAFTEYSLTDRNLKKVKGILRRNVYVSELCHLNENPEIERRLRHRLIDFLRKLFKKPPLFLADVYVFKSGSNRCWLVLESVPYSPKIAEAIRLFVQIDKERRGIRVIQNGQTGGEI